MSWKSAFMVCFCAFAVFATACGKDDGEDSANNNGGNSSLTFEEFEKKAPKLLAENLCTRIFACSEKQDPDMIMGLGRFANKEECIETIPQELWGGDLYKNEQESLQAGRLVFDATKAASCLKALEKAASQCNSIEEIQALSDCESPFTPKVKADEPCIADDECISGSCVKLDLDCFGHCGEGPKLAAEGESCDQVECAAGLYCVEDADETSSCVKAKSRQKGEACGYYSAVCANNLSCNSESVCDERQPLANEGDECSLGSTPIVCKPGMSCVNLTVVGGGLTGTCGAARALGEECQFEFECKPGLKCDGDFGTSGKCVVPKMVGESCQSDQECHNSLLCNEDTNKCYEELTDSCELPAN